jgi:hypothetical protein
LIRNLPVPERVKDPRVWGIHPPVAREQERATPVYEIGGQEVEIAYPHSRILGPVGGVHPQRGTLFGCARSGIPYDGGAERLFAGSCRQTIPAMLGLLFGWSGIWIALWVAALGAIGGPLRPEPVPVLSRLISTSPASK